MQKRYAIVGGGLSGLAAAYQLRQSHPQASVELFEAAARAGGVIHTEIIDTPEGRFVIDHGADMFATEPSAAMELCGELGVEDDLLIPDEQLAGAMIVHRGRLVPIPDGFVLMRATKLWQMVTTPLLSVPGKLRFLAERFIKPLRQHGRELADADLSTLDDISVGEFVRHRMGRETLDRLVGPLVAGIYTADVDKLSLHATMAPIVAMVRRHGSLASATLARRKSEQDTAERQSAGARYQKFRGFPEGMKQLIDQLADAIGSDSLHLQSPVRGMRFDAAATQWNLAFDSGEKAFDEVILATPSAVTAKLLGSISGGGEDELTAAAEEAAQSLAEIESASAAIVVLCIRKEQIRELPARFGFVVPLIEKRRILAASFASHKYASRCPVDHTIVRVFLGGAMQAELLEGTDDELIEIVRDELADLIGFEGRETLARVVRWNDAMPQYHVGHLQRAKRIEEAFARIRQLHLATNALHGVGIAPVIANARRVAMAIGETSES
ncbi:MAG: protoporphyrinogen oxidase [Planctomycetota bacterium]